VSEGRSAGASGSGSGGPGGSGGSGGRSGSDSRSGDRTIIVGTGVAGATAALTLRSEGYQGPITMIGEEHELPYRRPPLSKEVLRGATAPERIAIKAAPVWAGLDIEMRTGTRAARLDHAASTLVLVDGSELRYSKLLLATGAQPRRLARAAGVPGVHTIRSLRSATALAADLATRRPVLVIGGGLVGLEVAASARARGCAVTVLEAADRLLSRVLPAWLADPLAALHRDRGVEIHTGVALERFDHDGDLVTALAADGRAWRAATVVVAVGSVPDAELAETAGLLTDVGVIVDEYGRTSRPHVYAAGDVTDAPDVRNGGRHRCEHWNEAMEQGAAVAKTMTGTLTPFPTLPWSWSDQHGVTIQVCGRPDLGRESEVHGDPGARDASVVFRRGERVVGVVSFNRPAEFRTLRQLAAAGPQFG
jgi:3-phenylpropionate/trans-cinnamate dioxygenase ferredoxin reductase subunit